MRLFTILRRMRNALVSVSLGTTLVATPANAATFQGEFWNVSDANYSIAQALDAIDGVAPTATFISTAIDYPNGAINRWSSSSSLADFLGTDASSIVGDGTPAVTTSVFRFTGFVNLAAGDHTFNLGSDDGYRLSLNDTVVSRQDSPRGFGFTTAIDNVGTGTVPFELIFYENFGRTGVEFFIDDVLAVPALAPVPLPATGLMGLLGLTAFGLLKMRRRRTNSNFPLVPTA